MEGFDAYVNGASLHGVGGWTGWDNNPAATAWVTQAQSLSAVQAVDVKEGSDLVHEFSIPESGAWSDSAWQYIPSDFSSGGGGQFDGTYFNVMNTYNAGGPYHWSVQLQFDSNEGVVKVYHGDNLDTIDVPYETDRWVKIQAIVDLENDWTQVYYDDELITEYTWTGGVLGDGGGALDIAAVDLFANGSSSVFYDDLRLEPIGPAPPCAGPGTVRLDGDLDRDQYVGFSDLLLFIESFLDGVGFNLADIFPICGNGSVSLPDFAKIASQWQMCSDATNPNCIHKPLTLMEPPSLSHPYGAPCSSDIYGKYVDEVLVMNRGGEFFYHADELGSIVAVTDFSGNVVERYEYEDYGAPLAVSGVGNPYLFTGRRYDPETGLYYYRARYMDPQAGRFTTHDPLGMWGDSVNLGNGTSYVGNNPVSRVDPYGEDCTWVGEGIVSEGILFFIGYSSWTGIVANTTTLEVCKIMIRCFKIGGGLGGTIGLELSLSIGGPCTGAELGERVAGGRRLAPSARLWAGLPAP